MSETPGDDSAPPPVAGHPRPRPSWVRAWQLGPVLAVAGVAMVLTGSDVALGLTARLVDHRIEPVRTLLDIAVVVCALWWRRAPEVVLVASGTAFTLSDLQGVPTSTTVAVLLLGLYASGAYARSRRNLSVNGVIAFLLVTVDVVVAAVLRPDGFWTLDLVGSCLLASFWIAGALAHAQAQRVEHVERHAARVERERVDAAEAVAAERIRIARELHDVVAHRVTAMVVQAGAASVHAGRGDSRKVAATAAAIGDSGRQALEELRHVLGLLRTESPVVPYPGGTAEHLGDLTDTFRRAGLPVRLSHVGSARPMSSAAGASVYRIVEESLTNALKHGDGRPVDVTLHHRDDDVEIRVTNWSGPAAAGPRRGFGLLGMSERVALLGGHFSAGPSGGGQFAVRACIPREFHVRPSTGAA